MPNGEGGRHEIRECALSCAPQVYCVLHKLPSQWLVALLNYY